MTENEFIDYWNQEYPKSLLSPESFFSNDELKWLYPDRWFRVHSLPQSKRYAGSEAEYGILLDRQNQLITDLIGTDSDFYIEIGFFREACYIEKYKKIVDSEGFLKILTIDLNKQNSEDYEEETLLDVYVKTEKWQSGQRDEILKEIADDEMRAMFFSPSKRCVIAPYDGGVDVIVDSTERRDALKIKYKHWLSDRIDGM